MEEESVYQMVMAFEADDRLWKAGQRALRTAVADISSDGITIIEAPADLSGDDIARGPLEELLIGATADLLGSLLTKLVLTLLLQPRHPRTIELRGETSESGQSGQSPALEIDCADNPKAISENIHRWTATSISLIQRLVIRFQ